MQTEADEDEDDDDAKVNEDEENIDDEDNEDAVRWSKSPSPAPVSRPPLHTEQSGETIPSEVEDEDVDMAPADMVAEEDDYARFLASIKNRDLNEVRTEIDDEIRVLNAANKVAMRDSDEISQAMISQIQVSLLQSQAVRAHTLSVLTTPLWDPIHYRSDGSRSSMCQTRRVEPRRWDHHRRFGRVSLWR